MKKTHDLVVPLYDYITPNGQKKTKWLQVGYLFEMHGKPLIKINCIPTNMSQIGTGDSVPWDGWIKAFDTLEDKPKSPAKKKKKPSKPRKPRKTKDLLGDDMPF